MSVLAVTHFHIANIYACIYLQC